MLLEYPFKCCYRKQESNSNILKASIMNTYSFKGISYQVSDEIFMYARISGNVFSRTLDTISKLNFDQMYKHSLQINDFYYMSKYDEVCYDWSEHFDL